MSLLSVQFESQLIEDVYYACEDTTRVAKRGLLPLAYGQAAEVLDISDGDLWLVKTADPTTGKPVEGLVRRSWLTAKPPPPIQNGAEPQQNENVAVSGIEPGRTDKVQLRGHPPPTSSAPAAVMPGTLFGIYEPPKSMIFGKPHVKDGEITSVEQAIKKATPTVQQATPPPVPAASDELQRLQDTSVNSEVQLDTLDPVEMYVAIADFQASEESSISLKAGDHVQVGVVRVMSHDYHVADIQ